MTPPGPRSSRARFVVLFSLLILWQVWRLLLTPHGVPSTWARNDDRRLVSAGGTGVSQEIRMGADGFDGLWVHASLEHRGRPPLGGQIVLTLARFVDERPVALQRKVLDAADVGTGRPVHLAFEPIRESRGERYRVTLAHTATDDRGVLHLLARRSDAHRDARFFVNGVEQWGDLLFETTSGRATLPFWRHEILAAWPSWLRSWWTVVGVLLLVNVLLARACALAVSGRTTEGEPSHAAGAERGLMPRRTALLAVGVIVTVGVGALLRPFPSHRTIHLTDHLADARIETSGASVHEAIAVQRLAMLDRAYISVIALPTSRLAWTLDVPKGALLLGHVAMRPDVWHSKSDGANLIVSVVPDDGARVEVARYTLVPYMVAEHRALHPLRVSLDPWAGQTITLVLETDPERWGNAVNDVPVWVAPRIEWPRGTAWGEARIRRTPRTAAVPDQTPATHRSRSPAP